MRTRTYRGYRSGDAAAAVPIIETLTPARPPAVAADFVTPMLQSLFTGLVGGLVAAVGAWQLGGDVLTWAAVGFVGALALAWAVALGLVRDLLWTVERITGNDLDGDGTQGKPEAVHLMAENPDTARAGVATATRQRAYDARLAWLVGFVQRCYTVGTSESAQGIKPGERAQYLEARDLLLRLGLAAWRSETNKRLGWDVTTDQAHAIKVLREHVTAL